MEVSATLKLVFCSIVFITLSDSIGPGVFGCPSVCLCYVDEGGLRTANCTGIKFISENKYNKVFHEIGVLNIHLNNDEPIKLWDDMFISFTKLKLLNLQNCRINYLPKNVFKGLKKIFEINLASNDIRHFDNAVFENIYTLNKLNLRGNRLQGSYKPFISSSSLRELDLGYCGITALQNEFFHGVKKLTRLYLDGNHLQTVKEHILPTKITHLNLANNRIVNVPINTINSLSQLRWIDLGANPINCTCALMNLQDILSRHAIIIDGDLRCAYPPELENISLSKVNENEVCNKETFSSRYHFKKSQTTKYAPYQKKDYIFENEKYNPFEIQGDDPGTSTDDYFDLNENTYDEPKVTADKKQKTKEEPQPEVASNVGKHDLQPENLVDNKSEAPEIENNEDENLVDNIKSEKLIENASEHTVLVNNEENIEPKLQENESTTLNNENLKFNDSVDEHVTSKTDDDDDEKITKVEDTIIKDEVNFTTPIPVIKDDNDNDDDINVPIDFKNEKTETENFDENMKNDEVLPVRELSETEHAVTNAVKLDSNLTTTEKHQNIVSLDTDENKEDTETNPEVIITSENATNEHVSHLLKSSTIDPIEVEGSGAGSEEITITNTSIPIVNEDEMPESFPPDITEEPIRKVNISPVEHDYEKSTTDENEVAGQIVNKKPINYEEMGPYIVVACIVVFIVILILVAIYRGFCRSKDISRKPISDVEASNGTELQDITSSLLPKSPVNDEKHNNKYPNEVPSPETVNLIKDDKVENTTQQNDSHDLNQNDSKNEPVIKNGKHMEGSPPPIEKTKAKLTVLLESIPRTPIFLQKRPVTLNTG